MKNSMGRTTLLAHLCGVGALATLLMLALMIATPAAAEQATDLPSLEDQLAQEGTAVPQMGKPDPKSGFCRLSCGTQCDTSDDCPNGEPCDPFDSCPGGFDGEASLSLEEQLNPEPASIVCPFGAPRCFQDDHCDSYCGDPRFGVCSNFCCLCSG